VHEDRDLKWGAQPIAADADAGADVRADAEVGAAFDASPLDVLLSGIGECVVRVDAHWVVRHCNPAYLHGLGLPVHA
jgi:hypothetical protein